MSGEQMATALTAEDILAHPRFAEARSAHVDEVVKLFRSDRFVVRLMVDAGMIILRSFVVALHMSFDAGDRATWATSGYLKRALVGRGLASARRVDDILARFRQAGYVEDVPSPGDRRTRILVPTKLLLAHDRAHLAAYHHFLLDLFPGRGYEWILAEDDSAHRAIRRLTLKNQTQTFGALNHAAMDLFLGRDAGYLALLLVIQAKLSGTGGPTWTAMSDELGVSRSHLRTLFAEAEARGYVRLSADQRGPVEILPALWAAYNAFLAEIQAYQDTVAQLAFADLGQASA